MLKCKILDYASKYLLNKLLFGSEQTEGDAKSIHVKAFIRVYAVYKEAKKSIKVNILKPHTVAKIKCVPFEQRLHHGWDFQQKNVWHEEATLCPPLRVETEAQCLYAQISKAWRLRKRDGWWETVIQITVALKTTYNKNLFWNFFLWKLGSQACETLLSYIFET